MRRKDRTCRHRNSSRQAKAMELQVKDLAAAAVSVREAAHRSNMARQAKAVLAVVEAVVVLDKGVVVHHRNMAHQDKVVHREVSEEVHHRNTAHQDKVVLQVVSEEVHRNSMVHRHLNRNSEAQHPHRLPNMAHRNKAADLHHHNTVHHNKAAAAAVAVSVIKFFLNYRVFEKRFE